MAEGPARVEFALKQVADGWSESRWAPPRIRAVRWPAQEVRNGSGGPGADPDQGPCFSWHRREDHHDHGSREGVRPHRGNLWVQGPRPRPGPRTYWVQPG